jgi:hypothetical protein
MDLLTWDRLLRQQLTMGRGETYGYGHGPGSEPELAQEIGKWLRHLLLDASDLSWAGYVGIVPSGPCHPREPRHPVWAGW